MASIDGLGRSTKASRLQFSHAKGPRKLTSDGSLRQSSPDELKHPSGTPRDGGGIGGRFGVEAWASIIWESMRQLSKRCGASVAPGASMLTPS